MVDITTIVLGIVRVAQLALQVLYALTLTAWRFPPTCIISNATCYDFIIIGGGTAGSVLANRLSANSSYTVLLIETGGYPPIESEFTGLLSLLPNSVYDYNITSVNDNRTAQNLQGGVISLTAGKMLGGSSSLDHTLHIHGDPHDYNNWATILGDDSWNYTNFQKYLKKQENLADPELRNSNYVRLHGLDGPIKIQRQKNSANDGILAAAKELGHKVVEDSTSDVSTLGITQPLFNIDNQVRQSAAVAYLGAAKTRTNLCVVLYTTATEILIKNGVAVGVRVRDSNGKVYVLYANKEIVVSAGSLGSPKLLMLSGIGPKSHLESHNIKVVANLPVGENFQDHPSAMLLYQMKKSTSETPPTNPADFPVPTTCLYAAHNATQSYPDYQAINLLFPHDSIAQVQFSSINLKYGDNICNKWFAASVGRNTLFVVLNLMKPKSHGKVLLASADYNDHPLVYAGTYTDSAGADLALMAQSLADFNRFTSTKYFKSINATFVDLDLCSNYTGMEFWECYALAMSGTVWHYCSTCSMGPVLDTRLRVRGVKHLRVVDASSMPTQVSGNIKVAVQAIAEFGAELILKHHSTC